MARYYENMYIQKLEHHQQQEFTDSFEQNNANREYEGCSKDLCSSEQDEITIDMEDVIPTSPEVFLNHPQSCTNDIPSNVSDISSGIISNTINKESTKKQKSSLIDDWPESLVEYVFRCYAKCSDPKRVNEIKVKLYVKILQASLSGDLWTKDWEAEPLTTIEEITSLNTVSVDKSMRDSYEHKPMFIENNNVKQNKVEFSSNDSSTVDKQETEESLENHKNKFDNNNPNQNTRKRKPENNYDCHDRSTKSPRLSTTESVTSQRLSDVMKTKLSPAEIEKEMFKKGIAGPFPDLGKQGADLSTAKHSSDVLNQSLAFVKRRLVEKDDIENNQLDLDEPVLSINANIEIYTDASAAAITGVLMQREEDDSVRPIYYVSRKVNRKESRYSTKKLELLAVIWSVQHLRQFVLNRSFIIVTDCRSLAYLYSGQRSPMLSNWFLFLRKFNFAVKHRYDLLTSQQIDPLGSRVLTDVIKCAENDDVTRVKETDVQQETVFTTLTMEEVVRLYQSTDPEMCKLIVLLQKEDKSQTEATRTKEFNFKSGILYRTVEGQQCFTVPRAMRKLMLYANHNLLEHFDADYVINKLSQRYWFSEMELHVSSHISQCRQCIISKRVNKQRSRPRNSASPELHPFKMIHVDHFGPLPETLQQNQYILVIVDKLTKLVQLTAVKDSSINRVTAELKKLFGIYGIPTEVTSGNGVGYVSGEFAGFCRGKKIKHTAVKHPIDEYQVERVLVSLNVQYSELACFTDWDRQLSSIQYNINKGGTSGQFDIGDIVFLDVLDPVKPDKWSGPYVILRRASSDMYVVASLDSQETLRSAKVHVSRLSIVECYRCNKTKHGR